MQSETRMDKRKKEKITALLISAVVVLLPLLVSPEWNEVGIYSGCRLQGRLLYSFFHANILHAVLNAWCLLSLVFVYDISCWRMLLAYVIAVTVPVDTLSSFINMASPTVGLSAVVFVLFGSISFEVVRKWYYQGWMLLYLVVGFLFPNTNAWLHLYCYLAGLLVALLNKPVKSRHYGS